MTRAGDVHLSRNAEAREVGVAHPLNGPDRLPTVTLTICIVAVDALPHEHVTVALTPEVFDALDLARAELAELVVK